MEGIWIRESVQEGEREVEVSEELYVVRAVKNSGMKTKCPFSDATQISYTTRLEGS